MFPLLGTTRTEILYPWFNIALDSLFDDKKGKNECNIILPQHNSYSKMMWVDKYKPKTIR